MSAGSFYDERKPRKKQQHLLAVPSKLLLSRGSGVRHSVPAVFDLAPLLLLAGGLHLRRGLRKKGLRLRALYCGHLLLQRYSRGVLWLCRRDVQRQGINDVLPMPSRQLRGFELHRCVLALCLWNLYFRASVVLLRRVFTGNVHRSDDEHRVPRLLPWFFCLCACQFLLLSMLAWQVFVRCCCCRPRLHAPQLHAGHILQRHRPHHPRYGVSVLPRGDIFLRAG